MAFRAILKPIFLISLLPISTLSFAAEFPLEALPPHITLDLSHGERPDWTPTGSDSYIFVDAPGGKPLEKNRINGELRLILPPGCEDCRVWRYWDTPLPTRTTGSSVKTLTLARANRAMVVLTSFGDTVVFAELNVAINLLWVSIRPVDGVRFEISEALRSRIPSARIVSHV